MKLKSISKAITDFNISKKMKEASKGAEIAEMVIRELRDGFKRVYEGKKIQIAVFT